MKMKTKLLAALVALVLALGAHAELCVSEICPKPKGFDPNGFESGWIERYNALIAGMAREKGSGSRKVGAAVR